MMPEKVIYEPAFVSVLSDLFLDIYHSVRPRPSDYEQRRRLFQMLDIMAKSIFGSDKEFHSVQALGSFTMDIFTSRSDLDISVNFNHDCAFPFPCEHMKLALKRFASVLKFRQRKGQVSEVQSLLQARVPTVKVVDPNTGIRCDITVENKDGITRSLILKIVSSIDGRFRMLCYLMKAWAQAQEINSSQHHTLNSISIMTLSALHMQTRDPPILPPFSTLLRDGVDILSVQRIASRFRGHCSRRNEETVAELFDSLLRQLAFVQKLWEHGLCASVYEGSWIYRRQENKATCMVVEDFLDRSENFTRAVVKDGMKKIYQCIWSSVYHISCFMEGKIDASKLKNLLFGSILVDRKRRLPHQSSVAVLNIPVTTKRARIS